YLLVGSWLKQPACQRGRCVNSAEIHPWVRAILQRSALLHYVAAVAGRAWCCRVQHLDMVQETRGVATNRGEAETVSGGRIRGRSCTGASTAGSACAPCPWPGRRR